MVRCPRAWARRRRGTSDEGRTRDQERTKHKEPSTKDQMTRKPRIVIVDDEPNIGASLRLILEGEGYGVTICGSIAEFQAQRSPGRADLYLFDVRLPDGNGIDLLRAIRQNDDATPV